MKWKLITVLMAISVLAFVWFSRNGSFDNALRTRALATRGLAAYLAEKFPGQCAVIMSNPFTRTKGLPKKIVETEEAGIRGLREGFGDAVKVGAVAFPDLRPQGQENPNATSMAEGTTTTLSFMLADGAFDKCAAEHPECNLIVSLIGFPADLDHLKIWESSDPHRFALLLPDLRIVGDLSAVRRAMENRKLVAFVLNKPGAPAEQAGFSGSWKTAFDQRFFLVTSENFEQMLRDFPQAFEFAPNR